MKHKAFRWIPAVLLAALLAGCGAKTAVSARPAGSRERKTGQTTASRSTKTRCSPSGRSIRLWYSRMVRGYP